MLHGASIMKIEDKYFHITTISRNETCNLSFVTKIVHYSWYKRYILVLSFAHKSLAAPVESDQFYDAGNSKEDIIQLLAGYDIDKLRDMLSQSGVYHNLYNVSLNIAINLLVKK